MLKKPKNYRRVFPRCCANCAHRIELNDGFHFTGCERHEEEDRGFDGEAIYEYVCDYFKHT